MLVVVVFKPMTVGNVIFLTADLIKFKVFVTSKIFLP